MGIVITEIQEYCPELKMEQQGGEHTGGVSLTLPDLSVSSLNIFFF